MLYCLNLYCEAPDNADGADFCTSCGTRLLLRNRFRILKPLGEGGWGKTFLAQDCDKMDDRCVVKQLKYEARGTQANKKMVELFMREAQQLYQMRGQAQIPDLIAYFEFEGYFYLVQELIVGENLAQEKAKRLFDEEKVRSLLADVLPILSFIHQRGVIHRDLKPSNIMRRKQDNKLVLIDFGVSRQLSEGLTALGGITIVGTPGYAPFEQMTEGPIEPGPASDLYSLGVTCFALMSQTSPYPLSLREGYRWVEGWRQHVQQPVSEELQGILDRLLKMQSEERFQSADEVLVALNAQANLQVYQRHLAEYEAEYRKMVDSHWPLSSYLTEQLGRMQADWGLHPGDVERVEKLIRDQAETKHQARFVLRADVPQWEPAQMEPEPVRVEASQWQEEEQYLLEVIRQDAEQTGPQQQKTVVQPPLKKLWMKSRRNFLKLAALGGMGLGGGLMYQVVRSGESSKSGLADAFQEEVGNGVRLNIVRIPGGTFTMGSPETEPGRSDNEGPQREVMVPTFGMGQYEVTQAQYEAVMENNPSRFKGANRPVEQVTWHDAIEFCQKLSQLSGKDYRLPSEAEWEYACRARTTTAYVFGQMLARSQANFGADGTQDVGSFPANEFDLYDMHGNVYEWCLDHWHENYQGAPTDGSAWVTGGATDLRVLRGGSWYSEPEHCRSADRGRYALSNRGDNIGLRVVCSVARP